MPKGWNKPSSSSLDIYDNKDNEKIVIDDGDSSTAATTLTVSKAKKRALIVGISSYEQLQPLEFCKKDGEQMYLLLKNLGYEIQKDHKLIGDVNWETLRNAIINFFTDKTIKSKDTLLFYFSGHGLPDGTGDTFIATSNTDPDRPFDNGYSFDDLTKMMYRSISKKIVMVLDCCCSGSIGITKGNNDEEAANLARVAMDKKSKRLDERGGEGRCLLAASLPGKEAYAFKGKDHSLFTYHLLQGLKGGDNWEAVDNDGYVTPYSLGNYVYDKVTEVYPKQQPLIKTESAGRIILAVYPQLKQSSHEELIEIYKDEGTEYFANGDYSNAIASYDKALEINQQRYIIWHYKGLCLLKLEKYDEAIECFDIVLQLNPNYKQALQRKDECIKKLDIKEKPLEEDPLLSLYQPEQTNNHEKMEKYTSSVYLGQYSDTKDYSLETSWEIGGSRCHALAVDCMGNLYTVVEIPIVYGNILKKKIKWDFFIYKYDTKGNYLKKWKCAETESFKYSDGAFRYYTAYMNADSSGNVYVTYPKWTGYSIEKYDSDGKFITRLGNQVEDFFAIDSIGAFYKLDVNSNRIVKFDNTGKSLQGRYITNDSEIISLVSGVAISSNNFYVADEEYIKKYDSDGDFITRLKPKDSKPYSLNPSITYRTITTDSFDNIYVIHLVETDEEYIKKYDSDGNFITQLGSGQFKFKYPKAIVVDYSGNVYVVDNSGNYDHHTQHSIQRIQKFKPLLI